MMGFAVKGEEQAFMNTEAIGPAGSPPSKGALAAALSAIGIALAAATCSLPVLPFVLAAGKAATGSCLSLA